MKSVVKSLAYILAGVGIAFVLFKAYQWNQNSASKTHELSKIINATPMYQDQFVDGENKLTLVNFWASWCPPCIEETPSMLMFIKKNEQHIRLFSISQDDTRGEITKFLRGFPQFKQKNVRLIWDSERSLSKNFKVYKLPETFLFDKNGRLVQQLSGSIDWNDPALQKLIDSNK